MVVAQWAERALQTPEVCGSNPVSNLVSLVQAKKANDLA